MELSTYHRRARIELKVVTLSALLIGVWAAVGSFDEAVILIRIAALSFVIGLATMATRTFRGLSLPSVDLFVAACCDELRSPYGTEDCHASPASHVFVACDIAKGTEVYFSMGRAQSSIAVGSRESKRWEGSLAEVVANTMRFPGYAAVGSAVLGAERIPLVDGGVLDNEATSFYLRQPYVAGEQRRTLISIAVPRPSTRLSQRTAGGEFGLRDRLDILARSARIVHRHLSEYPLRLLEDRETKVVIRVRPGSDLKLSTSLRRLQKRKANQVFLAGHKSMSSALIQDWPHD